MLLQIHEAGKTPLPHAEDTPLALGIDLGTTRSLIGMADENGQVRVLAQTESIVSYDQATPVVGVHGIMSSKRLMGRGYGDEVLSLFDGQLALNQDTPAFQTPTGTKTPVEVAADILRHLKENAQNQLDFDVKNVVITVPAYFDDAARTATRQAAQLAGLNVLRLINEPTAAALAYGLDTGHEGVYAIYDWGGGTFDMSLLRLEKGVFQVLATGGDLDLGGDDIDHALAHRLSITQSEARRVKEKLTSLSQVGGFTQEDLNALAQPLVNKTLTISDSVLKSAKVGIQEVKGVVLVGGSTHMPYVKKRVSDFFGAPAYDKINPDEAVVYGAALQAYALSRGSDTLLLDVIPLSLGLETMGGLVEKLIHRNTPIPAQETQEFTTFQDGQTAMSIHVVQGEREFADDCRSLAKFELRGIPPLPAGVAKIAIDFMVDADGLLTVKASEKTTGISQTIEVKPSFGLDENQMRTMIESSQEHGREDMEKRLVVGAQIKARRLINEVQSALAYDRDLLTPQEVKALENSIDGLEELIQGVDRNAINDGVSSLNDLVQLFAEKRMNAAVQKALQGKDVTTV